MSLLPTMEHVFNTLKNLDDGIVVKIEGHEVLHAYLYEDDCGHEVLELEMVSGEYERYYVDKAFAVNEFGIVVGDSPERAQAVLDGALDEEPMDKTVTLEFFKKTETLVAVHEL